MIEVGIFDLKTHLSEMIGRVQNGEEFLVTNRGNPVALLTSPEEIKHREEGLFFSELNSMLQKTPLADDINSLKDMINEGRK